MPADRNNVAHIENHRKIWDWSYVQCQSCGHEWTAVHVVADEVPLECPECHVLAVVHVWTP